MYYIPVILGTVMVTWTVRFKPIRVRFTRSLGSAHTITSLLSRNNTHTVHSSCKYETAGQNVPLLILNTPLKWVTCVTPPLRTGESPTPLRTKNCHPSDQYINKKAKKKQYIFVILRVVSSLLHTSISLLSVKHLPHSKREVKKNLVNVLSKPIW